LKQELALHKLSKISGKEMIKKLEVFGFQQIRQKGSHVVLKKMTPNSEIGCVVPMHKELAIGTIHGILNQARISIDSFLEVQ
jgi:predicted RNA binding protein YcfA (HicA-like mRNA interferase family)